MTVAVDIGNTNIVVAAYDNGVWNKPFRVFTDTKKTGDEYYVIFSSLFDERGVDREKVDKVIISSVVPFLTRSIEKNMKRIFKTDPIMVTHSVESGLVKDTIPPELGADLLCNMAYGHHHHKESAVMVIDFFKGRGAGCCHRPRSCNSCQRSLRIHSPAASGRA